MQKLRVHLVTHKCECIIASDCIPVIIIIITKLQWFMYNIILGYLYIYRIEN